MKRFMSFLLAGLLVISSLLFQPVFARQQRRTVGNIKGLVIAKKRQDENKKEDEQPKDLGTSLQTTITSDGPMDKLFAEIPGHNTFFKGLIPKITTPILPEGWTAKKEEKGITFNGPASFSLIFRIDLPPNTDQLVEQLIKNGLSFHPSFGIYDYGTHQAEVKRGETTTPVNPKDAADFPSFVRIGHYSFFTPLEKYADDKWTVKINGKEIKDYPIQNTDPPKISELTPNQKTTLEKFQEGFKNQMARWERFTNPTQSFLIPKDTPLNAKIEVTATNKFGETTVKGNLNIKFLPDNSKETALLPPRLINCTSKLFQGETLCVCGFFPKTIHINYYQSHLLLDGKPLNLPLSASTDVATFLPKNLAPGKHTITWNIKILDAISSSVGLLGRPLPSPQEKVEFVVLEVNSSIVKSVIETTEKTQMQIEIIGTDEKIPIRLTNKTPNIIQLDGGNQVATTSGGSPNMLTRGVTGNLEGEFDIEYVLDLPPCPCNPEQDVKTVTAATGTVTNPIENPKTTETTTDEDCYELTVVYSQQSSRLTELILARSKAIRKCWEADLSFLPADLQDKLRIECTKSMENFHTPIIGEQEFILAGITLRYFLCKDKKK